MPKVTVTHRKRVCHVLDSDIITFDNEDVDGLMIPYSDALIISLRVHDTNVKRLLIDLGSSVNIILPRVVNEVQANDKVIPKARTLSRFYNSSVVTKEDIVLTTFAEGVIKDTKFHVIDAYMAYNMILGKPWIHDMDVVPSTLHQKLQNLVEDTAIKISTEVTLRQIDVDLRPDVIQQLEENENIKTTTEELEVVILFDHCPHKKVYIRANLSLNMKGMPPKVMTHKLNDDPLYPLVKQNKRKQGSFKNQVIQDEVQKLLKIDSIQEIKAIEEILDILTSKKEVQRLTGRIAALGRFISKSSEKSFKFFSVLKKQN
ncbi:uncharacterized protein [Nicotiana sylvestris]|uniref:uncharacterized protein n=1 Tax=Nicotiana sylvestris TaxID=4096 RepID=UPI00388C6B5E